MANNYYDATGVLVLDRVTPVITALFGGFKLDASHPGDGQAYIALVAEDNNPSWEDLCEGLSELATSLGLPLPTIPRQSNRCWRACPCISAPTRTKHWRISSSTINSRMPRTLMHCS